MENSKVKQKSSTIVKDALVLFLITLVLGLALSYVYEMTKEPIEQQRLAKKEKAYKTVYSDADTVSIDENLMELALETNMVELNASYEGITIDEVSQAYDATGGSMGYIVQVTTSQSYADKITLVIGYSKEGTVTGMEILSINETAGLGMNATKSKFKNQFSNKAVDQFEVTKTGATEDSQIDAISSATITSKAVTYAVNAGISFVKEYAEVGGGANE